VCGEGSIKLFGSGAVSRHPDIEAFLDIKALDVTEFRWESFAVMDEGGDDETVGPGRGAQLCLLFASQHLCQFRHAPYAGEIVAGPQHD
jgi:hypothetical protein